MTSANRATRIGKLHTLLKKAYKPTLVSENRPLMEHLLYACLLENAPYELADEALARLEQDYFDWNEVRVTTVTELTEVLARMPDPTAAALRLKKNLHGLFESTYSFDLEELKKQNLGKALQRFEKLPAITPFVLSYVTQHGLGGHAIPLDSAALRFFWLADIINESELKSGKVTGLERAIPKSKGVEFASLLHQAAVALNIDPNDETARSVVLTLNPDLDQKVADHVAAVKQRRVAKAIAAAQNEAQELANEIAESEKAASKSKSTKSAKPTKASKPTSGKTEDKEASKPTSKSKGAVKSETKPVLKANVAAEPVATESQSEADAEPVSDEKESAELAPPDAKTKPSKAKAGKAKSEEKKTSAKSKSLDVDVEHSRAEQAITDESTPDEPQIKDQATPEKATPEKATPEKATMEQASTEKLTVANTDSHMDADPAMSANPSDVQDKKTRATKSASKKNEPAASPEPVKKKSAKTNVESDALKDQVEDTPNQPQASGAKAAGKKTTKRKPR